MAYIKDATLHMTQREWDRKPDDYKADRHPNIADMKAAIALCPDTGATCMYPVVITDDPHPAARIGE